MHTLQSWTVSTAGGQLFRGLSKPSRKRQSFLRVRGRAKPLHLPLTSFTLTFRFPLSWLLIYFCLVQGVSASAVAHAIRGPHVRNNWRLDTVRNNGCIFSFYRAMHFSAERGLGIACRLSVCLSVTLVICDHIGWKSWKLIVRTISPTSSLFVAKTRSTYSQGNMGKLWGDYRGGVRKKWRSREQKRQYLWNT